MSRIKNPITEELLFLAHEGKSIRSISVSPEMSMLPNKKAIFHFKDGSTHELPTECDHRTFMRWWRETGQVLRTMKSIDDLPSPPEA